jgi:23S rRNA (cytosine1962-C5)-methyltransferase
MADLALQPLVMVGEGWADYGLVDSGHGRKLERYGPYRFIRPEPQAMWTPKLHDWQAHGEFVPGSDEDGGGRWQFDKPVPREGWPLSWHEAKFTAQCTPFRHLGFFPDMAPVWDWMRGQLADMPDAATLNLFGYTGVGSLALSQCGPVTHVDASKKSVAQARDNAALSDDRPADPLAGGRCR